MRKVIGEIRNGSMMNMRSKYADTAADPPDFLHELDRRDCAR
ncbi:hypothetical protein [Streptomyces sp. WELS2]|nr:hypothetical protein [Streptomyces sp. WELS2]